MITTLFQWFNRTDTISTSHTRAELKQESTIVAKVNSQSSADVAKSISFRSISELGDPLASTTPEQDSDSPPIHCILAGGYMARFEKTSAEEDLNLALKHGIKAMEDRSVAEPAAPEAYESLASTYSRVGTALGHLGILDQGLRFSLRAHELYMTPDAALDTRIKEIISSIMYRLVELRDQSDPIQPFEGVGTLSDLDDSILYISSVTSALRASAWPHGYPLTLPRMQQMTGEMYRARFTKTSSHEDLDHALDHGMQALENTAPTGADVFLRYASLADTYGVLLHAKPNDLDIIEHGISFLLRATEAVPIRNPLFPICKSRLASFYEARYNLLNKREDIDAALDCLLSVISSAKTDRSLLPTHFRSYKGLYIRHYNTYRDADFLDSSLHRTRELQAALLALMAETNLSLSTGYSFPENVDRIRAAIKYAGAALDATPSGHPDLTERQDDLASTYYSSYVVSRQLEDLEQALQFGKKALESTRPDDHRLPERHHKISICYAFQFGTFFDFQDFELAVKHSLAAIEHSPADDPNLPTYHGHLSMLYCRRFDAHGDASDLDEAIKLIHSSSAVNPSDLAIYHAMRYKAFGQLHDIEKAIEFEKSALETIPTDSPSVYHVYSLLSEYYKWHYDATHDPQSLDLCISYCTKMINLPTDHPDFGNATHSFGIALLEAASRLDKDQIWDAVERSASGFKQAALSSSSPAVIWQAAVFWGATNMWRNHRDCVDAFSIAFKALPELVWMGNPINLRHRRIKRSEVPFCAALAALAAIRQSSPERAVEFLEQGSAITYRQMLQLKDSVSTKLMEKHPVIATRFRELSSQLQRLNKEMESPSSHRLTLEREKLIKTIRTLEGFEEFLLPPTFANLSCAAEEGPVIMITCQAQIVGGGHAIIVVAQPQPRAVAVPLPELTDNFAQRLLVKLREALLISGTTSRGSNSASDRAGRPFRLVKLNPKQLFTELIDSLNTSIVEPVFRALKEIGIENGRIWWCPTGAVTYLPLHAAGAAGPYIQSYTFTLDALIQARRRTTPRFSVTAIAVPEIVGRRDLGLLNVVMELEMIKCVTEKYNIDFQDLTGKETDALLTTHIRTASWLHLACHGEQNLNNPLESKLLLRDGFLQLKDVLTTESTFSDAQFVFLSACQTAMGDGELANEAMHMAGVFITAGFLGAVGTLWSIADIDGPRVVEEFYKHLFAAHQSACQEDEDPTLPKRPAVEFAAEALQVAVSKLRQEGVPFERWMPFVHFGI